MLPALLGVSVAQLSLLINTQIASHVGVGAVSWLTFADRLMEFPTALLGVALGVVLLPQLSAAQARDDAATYSSLLDWGLRLVRAAGAAVRGGACSCFRSRLVAVLYHYGAFSARDVQQTVLALMGYGVGLMGLVGVKVLAPGFYARQDMRTPVRIAIAHAGADAVDEPRLRAAARPCRAGAVDRPGGAAQCAAAAARPAPRRASTTPQPGWAGLHAARRCGATALLGAGLAWAAQAIDWIALGRHPALRDRLAGAVRWARGAALLRCAGAVRPVAAAVRPPKLIAGLSFAAGIAAEPCPTLAAWPTTLRFEVPTALDYFAMLVADDASLSLVEAAASIAQDEHPQLDVQAVLAEIDALAAKLRRRVPADAVPLQRLRVLNRFFFHELGFAGNVNHYHDPRNSYLHEVLRSRRGIPITLAVLYIELAQQIGLRARGVSFPGHFLVKLRLSQGADARARC